MVATIGDVSARFEETTILNKKVAELGPWLGRLRRRSRARLRLRQGP